MSISKSLGGAVVMAAFGLLALGGTALADAGSSVPPPTCVPAGAPGVPVEPGPAAPGAATVPVLPEYPGVPDCTPDSLPTPGVPAGG
ncbi:hypothetical protein [Pseudonocardia sp. ICBG1293]|uniref:hypothetical protein n=1 Tax=Pseudonocardia sp. ICBG1293 TaxID=2844382 RepID=UPI001CCCCA82|nr:hypothetical protein [Pseudonocardia sp. ICBG1293]